MLLLEPFQQKALLEVLQAGLFEKMKRADPVLYQAVASSKASVAADGQRRAQSFFK